MALRANIMGVVALSLTLALSTAGAAVAGDDLLKQWFNGDGDHVRLGTGPITHADRRHASPAFKVTTLSAAEASADPAVHDDDPDDPGIQVVVTPVCDFAYCYQDGSDATDDPLIGTYDPADYPDNDPDFHGFVPYVLGDMLPPMSTTLDE